MSASQSPAVAAAARRYAMLAEAAATGEEVRVVALRYARESLATAAAKQAKDNPSQAARVWFSIPMKTRILAALTLGEGDPETIARCPWGSLPDEQRRRLGINLRALHKDTREAVSLT
jgi:hypothetical protein